MVDPSSVIFVGLGPQADSRAKQMPAMPDVTLVGLATILLNSS